MEEWADLAVQVIKEMNACVDDWLRADVAQSNKCSGHIPPPTRYTDSANHGSASCGQRYSSAAHRPRTEDRVLDDCVDAEGYADGVV